jgi:hypothetical protein
MLLDQNINTIRNTSYWMLARNLAQKCTQKKEKKKNMLSRRQNVETTVFSKSTTRASEILYREQLSQGWGLYLNFLVRELFWDCISIEIWGEEVVVAFSGNIRTLDWSD